MLYIYVYLRSAASYLCTCWLYFLYLDSTFHKLNFDQPFSLLVLVAASTLEQYKSVTISRLARRTSFILIHILPFLSTPHPGTVCTSTTHKAMFNMARGLNYTQRWHKNTSTKCRHDRFSDLFRFFPPLISILSSDTENRKIFIQNIC